MSIGFRSIIHAGFVLTPCIAFGQTAAVQPGGQATVLPEVTVVGVTPLLGSGVDRDKVPAATTVLDSKDIARNGPADALNALQEQVGPINLNSASGNPQQPTLLYHGFAAGALQGTEQGLAVYVNGVRFNQAFGDTVNWDLIPNIAIDRVNIEGSNPAFGLNALGGAINIQLKNGFTYHGAEADLYGGSFGQIGGEFQYGKQSGNFASYIAGSGLRENGWRDLQSSDLENIYGDLGWRTDRAEIHVNLTLAHSELNGPGTSPVQLLAADPAAQFTAPNALFNQYSALSVSGNYAVSDHTSIQALAYYDYFHQIVSNANAPNDTPCNDGSGLLCDSNGDPSTTLGGGTIPAFLGASPFAYSELDDQTTNTNGYGASAQVTNTHDVFGLHNQFVAGVSFDGAQTMFSGTSLIGGITPFSRVFVGPGVVIDEPGQNQPVRVAISNASFGLFLVDTLDLTSRLSVTASGRLNAIETNLNDQNGGGLTGNHYYSHLNPGIGAAYKVAPWLNVYAGYSEANRAPTPAELSCAGPENSCSLANFFVGDPNLKQVVAHTIEAGIRGSVASLGPGRLSYNIGVFHTMLDDDIAFVNSEISGRAFFTNIGQTRRQGVDLGLKYQTPRWNAWIDYSYIDATYQNGFIESAGSNPAGDAEGNIAVQPGDQLPGIPHHQLKIGASYKVTDKWVVGVVGIAESQTFLVGDEANLTAPLPAFFTLNLNTSYQITPHVQLFGLVSNVTNAKYYTFGTFSPTSSVFLAQAPTATNPRAYSPAAPVGGFAGVKVTF